ncbi:hypothetical protein AB6G04_08050 [Proteus mirabilis]
MITPPLFKLNKEQSAILRIAKITSIAQQIVKVFFI